MWLHNRANCTIHKTSVQAVSHKMIPYNTKDQRCWTYSDWHPRPHLWWNITVYTSFTAQAKFIPFSLSWKVLSQDWVKKEKKNLAVSEQRPVPLVCYITKNDIFITDATGSSSWSSMLSKFISSKLVIEYLNNAPTMIYLTALIRHKQAWNYFQEHILASMPIEPAILKWLLNLFDTCAKIVI